MVINCLTIFLSAASISESPRPPSAPLAQLRPTWSLSMDCTVQGVALPLNFRISVLIPFQPARQPPNNNTKNKTERQLRGVAVVIDYIRYQIDVSINQTDYILCSQKWGSSIQSVKTRPGADCGSDHELLIAKFRLKLKKVRKTTGYSGMT